MSAAQAAAGALYLVSPIEPQLRFSRFLNPAPYTALASAVSAKGVSEPFPPHLLAIRCSSYGMRTIWTDFLHEV